MPFAGEERLVAAGLEYRRERPLGRRQAAALALEGHSGHAAAVRNTPGLHGSTAGGATRLGVKRQKGHTLGGQAVKTRRRHTSVLAAAVGAGVAVAEVVRQNENDIWLLNWRLRLGRVGASREGCCQHGHARAKADFGTD